MVSTRSATTRGQGPQQRSGRRTALLTRSGHSPTQLLPETQAYLHGIRDDEADFAGDG
jgi:hypothetical protein